MVGVIGFEPTTTCTPCKCATGLRHTPCEERSIICNTRPQRKPFWEFFFSYFSPSFKNPTNALKSNKSCDSATSFPFLGDNSFRRRPIAAGIPPAPIGLRRARVGAGAPRPRRETKIAHRPGFANRPKSPAFCARAETLGAFHFRLVAALLSTVCCRLFTWERPGLRREPVFFWGSMREVLIKNTYEIIEQLLLRLSCCANSKKSKRDLQWSLESYSFDFSTPAQKNPTEEGINTSRIHSLSFFLWGGCNAFYHVRKLRSSVSFAQIGSPSREAKRKWNGKEPQRAGKERKVERAKSAPGGEGERGGVGNGKGGKKKGDATDRPFLWT